MTVVIPIININITWFVNLLIYGAYFGIYYLLVLEFLYENPYATKDGGKKIEEDAKASENSSTEKKAEEKEQNGGNEQNLKTQDNVEGQNEQKETTEEENKVEK